MFSIVACTSCRHVRVEPRVANERLGDLYDDDYYHGNGFDLTIDYEAEPSRKTQEENADIVESIAEATGGSVRGLHWLDVGCGTGTLLESAAERGAIVTGSDSSQAALESCRRKGIPFLDTEALERSPERFDIVSAVEVIEHVPDPLAFVLFLKAHVRDGGIIFVRTGNWNIVRYLPGTPYVMPEGHIQYFTPSAMRRLFASASLKEVSAFNRTWFIWRLLPSSVRAAVPRAAFQALAGVTRRFVPGLAPFPIARA